MSSVVHIAPQLPPAIDGVGDYCRHLWRHWPEPLPDWKFLVLRGADETAREWPEVQTCEFGPASESLTAALERSACDTAVLHYVGYGFQPKGIPTWLPGAIAAWKRADSKRCLTTMFHEMYASSSPLRSPFWVAPIARKIIRELIGISDSWVTSCERYLNQLTSEFNARHDIGRVVPIGSNIPVVGEFSSPRDAWSRTEFHVAVFGLPRTRLWALERHWRLLRALSEAGALNSITLLGQANGAEDERIWQDLKRRVGAEARWRLQFNLSIEDISRELLDHDLGLLANEPDTITKSGVFAAFAAHGVIPIVSCRAPAALPARFREAVIENDESGNISELEQMLTEPEQMRSRRQKLLQLAVQELSWKRVTRDWSALLQSRELGVQARKIVPPYDENSARCAAMPQPLVTQP